MPIDQQRPATGAGSMALVIARDRVSDYPRSIQVLAYKEWEKADIDKRTEEAKDLILKNP